MPDFRFKSSDLRFSRESLRRAPPLAYLTVAIAGWPAPAQTNTAEIAGVVRDSVGGVLPGVAITARHPDTGFSVERVTDAGGRFFLPALRVGTWEIKAELAGLRAAHRAVVLEIGRTLSLDLTLGLAGLSEQVRVSGPAPLLQVTTAEISDVISNTRSRRDPSQRPEFSGARPVERRGRPSSRRHARGGAAAGGTAAERRRAALRAQHLHAGRRQGDGRTVQQPRHQSVRRFDPGVQDPEVDVRAGVRRQGVGADQCRHALRREHRPGNAVRVPARRRLRFAELLPAGR